MKHLFLILKEKWDSLDDSYKTLIVFFFTLSVISRVITVFGG